MKQLLHSIGALWREKLVFKLAASFLGLLLVLALALPWLPLAFSPNHLDLAHIFQPPFEDVTNGSSHLLGTDSLGRDVLSNVMWGTRTAFFISLPVMVLATLLGTTLGAMAGFYGDTGFRISRKGIILAVVTLLSLSFYGLYLPLQMEAAGMGRTEFTESLAVGLTLPMLLWVVLKLLSKRMAFLRKKVAVSVDQLVLRLTEALSTIPRFVLILVLASFMPPSVLLLSLIIVLTIWTNIARLARAEMLRIKQLPYFEAAKSLGLNTRQLIWRQAIPNLLGPVLVAFTFGLGSLLALESTLSFFNIGVPTTLVSWGRIIANVRSNTSAWWLVAFPGGMLTLTILSLYTCSHYLSKVLGK